MLRGRSEASWLIVFKVRSRCILGPLKGFAGKSAVGRIRSNHVSDQAFRIRGGCEVR